MIQALIFDFDGLILDTESPELQSWQEIYQTYGHELPVEQWLTCVGGSYGEHFAPYEYLESLVGRSLPREEILVRRRQRHLAAIETLSALPGIEMYLTSAKERGLKLAVASNSSRGWVSGHLSRLGLYRHFDTIACGDEVEHKKPQPDVYLAALKALGVEARESIALEDSPHGVTAAQKAGVFCVAVPNQLTRQLSLEHADLSVRSLATLPLGDLIALVEKRQSGLDLPSIR